MNSIINIINVKISQDHGIPTSDWQTDINKQCETLEGKSAAVCKFYALYEFKKFYESAQKHALKNFNLSKPIGFIVSWNGSYFNTYRLKRILSNKNKTHEDFSF